MLNDSKPPVIHFPIEVFPTIFRELVLELKNSLNYPIDYSATSIMAAVSSAIGTSAKIKVKNNWYEYASIYCCIIGNAGANKTHPIKFAFEPLKSIDKVNHDCFVDEFKKYKKYESLTKKEKLGVEEVKEPKLAKHVLTNFTSEALNKRLNENLRGCAVVSDEMATFFEGMNNYSKGDQISVYLTIWSNQSTTIDRSGEEIPLFIKSPFLSIIGGLQPRMLGNSFPIQKLNNGFFQRFLFAYPEVISKQPINDNELDDSLVKKYSEFIKSYVATQKVVETDSGINSKILNWTKEAKDFFFQWQKENCELVNEHMDNIKGEILSKYDNHFLRLSLLLQIMDNPESENIELKAVKGAEKLCNYYISSAFKVLTKIQNPITYLDSLAENKRNIFKTLKQDFSTSEAIEVGNNFGLQERRIKEFLKDDILFNRTGHGCYSKRITK